jgi:O-antigen/teichoic acid export membrane protein
MARRPILFTKLPAKLFAKPIQDARLARILHGSLSALVGRGVGLLVSAITLPLTVRYLGPQRYGIWVTVSSTIIMLAVLDLGIANSLTNSISRAYAAADPEAGREAARRSYASAFWISAALACLLAIIAALLWPHISWSSLFHLPDPAAAHEASLCVAIALAFFLLGLPLNLINRVLSGFQQTQITNYFNLVANLGSLAAILTVIAFHGSLVHLMCSYSASLLLGTIFLNLWVHFWDKPWLFPLPNTVSTPEIRSLIASGSGFFILQIAGLVVFNSDNLVITHYLGASEVAPYSVAWRLAGYAAVLQTAVFPSLWPAYSEAYARGDYAWVRRTFWNAVRLALGTTAIAVTTLAIFGRPLIRWYIGPTAMPPQILLTTICAWTLLSAAMDLQACLLAAINRVHWQGILSAIAAALNIALSITLVQRLGSLGVVLGTMLSYLIILVGPQTFIVWKALYRHPASEGLPLKPAADHA